MATPEEIPGETPGQDRTPEELAVQYEGLAAKIAGRKVHCVPGAAADFDDLKAVAWAAILDAARSYDGRIPWRLYAGLVARRAVNDFIRVERRRGLTNIGDNTRAGVRDFEGPKTVGLGEWAGYVPARKMSAATSQAEVEDAGRETNAEIRELLDRIARMEGVNPRVPEMVGLMLRHRWNQSDVARHLGIGRERVGQLLRPVWEYLREARLRDARPKS